MGYYTLGDVESALAMLEKVSSRLYNKVCNGEDRGLLIRCTW